MKRIISNLMLVAAAAMAFFACQKQEVNAPEMVKVEGLSFSAEKPEFADASKTEWTGETIQWSEGDKIRVAYTADGVWQNAEGNATADEENGEKTAKIYASNSVEAGETASFSVPGNFTIPTGVDLEFYGVYPSTAASDASMPYAPSVTVTIPAEQKPLANSFDSKGDLMAAKSVSTYILSEENPLPEAIPLMWTRMVAHGHLTLKNLQVEEDEKLQTITLTADENADMVGQYYLYLDTYNVEKASGNNAANSLTVKADNLTIAEGGNVTFWTCFRPCTWKSLDVVVETDKATYTREIDLATNQKTFAQNARNTLAINMATAERVVRASSALPFERDFSNTEYNQNAITELDGFTIENSVYNAKGAIRLAKTDAGGSVTTLPLDLSQNFHVKVVASGWDDDELTLTVTAGDQSNNLTLVTSGTVDNGPKECAEYIINFQPVSNSASVTFTTEAKKRCYIQKIQVLEGHAELTPVLSATNPDEMSAEGGEGSFTYTLSNPKDGKTVLATENSDWIENLAVNQEAKTVSYNVAENTSEESRTATITLSYDGAQSVDVTVSQAGKPTDGESGWIETSFANLKAGDQVVIVGIKSSKYYALLDNNGGANDPPIPSEVKVSGNKLSDVPADNIIWHVGVDEANRAFYTDASGDKWLYCTNNNDGVRVGTNTNKIFTWDSNYLKHVGTSRYLGIYNTQDWRCYTSSTATNIANQSFKFFVKVGGEESKPEPVTLGTPSVTCDEAKTTENSLTFTWTAVENATKYKVQCNGKTVEQTETTYTATGLTADTEYTISVTALGDGTTYTDSDAGTKSAKTSTSATPPTAEDIVASGNLTSGKTDLVLESGKAITYSEIKGGQNYAEYTGPARFYGDNQVQVMSSAGVIKKIVVTCTSPSYATAFTNSVKSLGSISTSDNTVTLTLTTPAKTVSWTNTAQWRANTMTVTYSSTSGDETEGGGETPDPTPDPDVESVTVTLNPGDSNAGTWTNSQKTSTASVGNVTFTALGTGGNDSKYYSSDQTWRFYTANTSGVKVSVPTGSAITKVVITVTKGSPSTPSGCTVSSANKVYTYTVSNSPTELSFFKSGSDNLQINKIEVTYTN